MQPGPIGRTQWARSPAPQRHAGGGPALRPGDRRQSGSSSQRRGPAAMTRRVQVGEGRLAGFQQGLPGVRARPQPRHSGGRGLQVGNGLGGQRGEHIVARGIGQQRLRVPHPASLGHPRAVLTPPAAHRTIEEQSLRPEFVCQPCVQCALPLALRRTPCSRCQAEHISSSHAGCSLLRAYTRVRTGRRRATEPAAPSGGAAPWQHGAGWQAPRPPDAARARGARAGRHLGGGHVGGLQRQAGTQRAPQDAQHAPAVERHLVHRERLRRAARCGGRRRRRRRRRRRSDVARRRR